MTEPAPLRTAAELDTRVARMNPERTLRLEAQVRFLAERSAALLAKCIQGERLALLQLEWPDDEEQASIWRDLQDLMTEGSAKWTARREALKSTVDFERATIRIREQLSKHLKGREA